LKTEDITFQDLPEQEYEEAFISVKQEMFKEDELSELDRYELQDTYLLTNYLLASKLEEPIKVERNIKKDNLTEIFNDIVYYPEEYTFWNWNKDLNVLIFFQNKMD